MKTAFFISFQAQQAAERKWQKIVQIQNFVRGTGKVSGHAAVNAAEQTVFPLGKAGRQFLKLPGGRRAWGPEWQRDGKAADLKVAAPIAGALQSLHKAFHHLPVGKSDGGVHGQLPGFAVSAHSKAGQPPVGFLYGKQAGIAPV